MSAGVVVDAGFVDRGSNWNSGTSTVTEWLPLKSESLTETPTLTRSEVLGQVSQHKPVLTRLAVAGDLVAEYDYNYGHGLLQYALGAEAGGVYSTADELPYFGVEIDKGVSRWRYGCLAANRLSISAGKNGVLMVTYGCAAYQEFRASTAFPSIRPAASARERAVFEHAVFRLGDTADALGSGDVVGVEEFELVLENNLEVEQQDSASSKRVLAPIRNGFRTGTLRLNFARYTSALESGGGQWPLDTWRDNNTELQADIVFTGSSGSFTIKCPTMHFQEGADATVGGPQVIGDSATFSLDAGTNSNMTGDQLELVAA